MIVYLMICHSVILISKDPPRSAYYQKYEIELLILMQVTANLEFWYIYVLRSMLIVNLTAIIICACHFENYILADFAGCTLLHSIEFYASKSCYQVPVSQVSFQVIFVLLQSPEEEYNPKEIICAICNVKCSGLETYNSHLHGKQHAKTVKLQKSRGCEIPDVRPQTSSGEFLLLNELIVHNQFACIF